MHIVLVHPEIAPNTGNIIRLCANAGASLHLVEPLGFTLDERNLRRAGLDYHELADVTVHADLEHAVTTLRGRWFTFSSNASTRYTDLRFEADDVLVFGAERSGLSESSIGQMPHAEAVTIPMMPANRSLNLANAVAIVVYEAWRQHEFAGAATLRTSAPDGLTAETPGSTAFDG